MSAPPRPSYRSIDCSSRPTARSSHPCPTGGESTSPRYLPLVGAAVAEVKGCPVEMVAESSAAAAATAFCAFSVIHASCVQNENHLTWGYRGETPSKVLLNWEFIQM